MTIVPSQTSGQGVLHGILCCLSDDNIYIHASIYTKNKYIYRVKLPPYQSAAHLYLCHCQRSRLVMINISHKGWRVNALCYI
jgi:hypothetical protein